MTYNELVVGSKEQTLDLGEGYIAEIRFDPFYKRWYYNLYKDDVAMYSGVALNPDTLPLNKFTTYSLGLVDKLKTKDPYEPYNELGVRLGLVEVAL